MQEGWNIREEILKSTHQWPVILGFCLVGILLGWALSWVFPAKYRSVKAIYVGINAYNAFADRNAAEHAGVTFNNPDDYKNWQMANLNALITSENIFKKTLVLLQSTNTGWNEFTTEDLAQMLHAKWRNAGKWYLTAESDNPELSTQAVLAWHDIVLVDVQEAIAQAQNAYTIDLKLKSINDQQTQLYAKKTSLEQTQINFSNIHNTLITLTPSAPVPEDTFTTCKALTSTFPEGEYWGTLIIQQPGATSQVQDCTNWVNQVLISLEYEIENIESRIKTLDEEYQKLSVEYAEASDKSFGLSPNLQVERISTFTPKQTALHPTGFLVLLGGIFGLFAWILFWLGKIAMGKSS